MLHEIDIKWSKKSNSTQQSPTDSFMVKEK